MKTLMKKVMHEERLKAKFYRNLEKFLTDGTSLPADKEIVKERVKELSENESFNPVLYWMFRPVSACEAALPYEGFSVRYNALFKCNGKHLCDVETKCEEAVATVKDRNELWLLEDMSFAVVRCIEMTDNDEEHMAYRFVIGKKLENFDPYCDVLDLLDRIENLIENNTDMYEE